MTKNLVIAILILPNICVFVFAFSQQIEAEKQRELAEQQTLIVNKMRLEEEEATAKALKLWQESRAQVDSLVQAAYEE